MKFPAMATCIYKCHAKTMRLTPPDHIADFIDSHSRVKHTADQKQSLRSLPRAIVYLRGLSLAVSEFS